MRPTRHVTIPKEATPDYAAFWSAFIQVFRTRVEGASTGSTIRVTTGFIGEQWVVTVDDHRPGADWGVTELAGCNPGIAAMRSACKALDGSIEIQARNGEGTRISFAFPKHATNYEGHTAVLPLAKHKTSAA